MSIDAARADGEEALPPEVLEQVEEISEAYLALLRRGRDLAAAHPAAGPVLEQERRLCDVMHGAGGAAPNGPGTAADDAATLPKVGPPAEPGTGAGPEGRRLGRYVLREVLGQGGLGVVYRAWDPQFRRDVALKVLRAERLDDARARAEIERDARIIAHLRHPNIVPLHETGCEGGVSYIDMELVRGPSLEDRLGAGPLPLREGVQLVRKVAEALHYAHEKGIIHRDVKAKNILLEGGAEPQLTDFGLARREKFEETITREGVLVGTLDTMSPEQAAGRAVDRRTDVYSLGVVLYQVLTGRLPLGREGSVHERLRRIGAVEPARPRSVNAAVPAGLEAVCVKALAKDARERFGTCQELADELRRWLADEPLVTRPAGVWERGRRWLRRHRVAAGVGLGLVVALLMAWTAGVWQAGRSAETTRAEGEIRLLLLRAWTRLQEPTAGRKREVRDLLRQTAAYQRRLPASPLREELDRDVRSVYAASLAVTDMQEALGAPRLRLARNPGEPWRRRPFAALRPDGTAVAVAANGKLQLVPVAASGRPEHPLESVQIGSYLAYGPAGRRLAWAWEDGRLTVHDGESLEVVATLAEAGTAAVVGMMFTVGDERLWWCRADGHVGSWSPGEGVSAGWRLPGPVTAAAFATGAGRLIVGDRDGRFAVYGTDGQEQHPWESLPADWGAVDKVALGPDPELVAVCCKGGMLFLGRLGGPLPRRPTWTQPPCLPDHCLELSPDGRWLTWSAGARALLLDVAAGRVQCRVAVGDLCRWSADGRQLLSLEIGRPLIHNVQAPEVFTALVGHGAAPVGLAWSGDGTRLASLDARYEVRTWDRARGALVDAFAAKPPGQFAGNCGLALDNDGRRLLFVSGTEPGGRALLRAPGERRDLGSWPVEVGFSYAGHDGERFVVVREERDGEAKRAKEPEAWPAKSVLYEVAGDGAWRHLGTLRPAAPNDLRRILVPKLSEDGRRYLWEGPRKPNESWRVEVWDVATRRREPLVSRSIPLLEADPDHTPVTSLSLDGRWAWMQLPRSSEGTVRLDVASGREVAVNGLLPRVGDSDGRWRVGAQGLPPSPFRGRLVLMRGASDEVWLHLPSERPSDVVRMGRAGGGRYVAWGEEDGTVMVADLEELERRVDAFEREIRGE